MARSRLHYICALFNQHGRQTGLCGVKHLVVSVAENHVLQLNAQRWPADETWVAVRIGGTGDPEVLGPGYSASQVVAWHLASRSTYDRPSGDGNPFERPRPEPPWVDRGLPAMSRAC